MMTAHVSSDAVKIDHTIDGNHQYPHISDVLDSNVCDSFDRSLVASSLSDTMTTTDDRCSLNGDTDTIELVNEDFLKVSTDVDDASKAQGNEYDLVSRGSDKHLKCATNIGVFDGNSHLSDVSKPSNSVLRTGLDGKCEDVTESLESRFDTVTPNRMTPTDNTATPTVPIEDIVLEHSSAASEPLNSSVTLEMIQSTKPVDVSSDDCVLLSSDHEGTAVITDDKEAELVEYIQNTRDAESGDADNCTRDRLTDVADLQRPSSENAVDAGLSDGCCSKNVSKPNAGCTENLTDECSAVTDLLTEPTNNHSKLSGSWCSASVGSVEDVGRSGSDLSNSALPETVICDDSISSDSDVPLSQIYNRTNVDKHQTTSDSDVPLAVLCDKSCDSASSSSSDSDVPLSELQSLSSADRKHNTSEPVVLDEDDVSISTSSASSRAYNTRGNSATTSKQQVVEVLVNHPGGSAKVIRIPSTDEGMQLRPKRIKHAPAILGGRSAEADKQKPSLTNVQSVTCERQVRPVAKMLQDLGLLLSSELVFKDLIRIQKRKMQRSKTNSAVDVLLLGRLKVSHENMAKNNQAHHIPMKHCYCGFASESTNVIRHHGEEVKIGKGSCCLCRGMFTYRNRNAFARHLASAHSCDKLLGTSERLSRQDRIHQCATCTLEFSSVVNRDKHQRTCAHRFAMSRNMAPSTADMDIPQYSEDLRIKSRNVSSVAQQTPVISSVRSLSQAVKSLQQSHPQTQFVVTPPQPPSQVFLEVLPVNGTEQYVQIGDKLYGILPTSSANGTSLDVNTLAPPPCLLPRYPASILSGHNSTQIAQPVLPLNLSTTSNLSRPTVVVSPPQQHKYEICPVCKGFVRDAEALRMHMAAIHPDEVRCEICHPSVYFKDIMTLNDHMTECHSAQCWMCTCPTMPLSELLPHIAKQHGITMAQMLKRKRCSLCPTLPSLHSVVSFEHHMLMVHAAQFRCMEALWDIIDRSILPPWNAKYSADGTLECAHCTSNFISRTFLCRHHYLVHGDLKIGYTKCHECGEDVEVGSPLMAHLTDKHVRPCSVSIERHDMDGSDYCTLSDTSVYSESGEQIVGHLKPKMRPSVIPRKSLLITKFKATISKPESMLDVPSSGKPSASAVQPIFGRLKRKMKPSILPRKVLPQQMIPLGVVEPASNWLPALKPPYAIPVPPHPYHSKRKSALLPRPFSSYDDAEPVVISDDDDDPVSHKDEIANKRAKTCKQIESSADAMNEVIESIVDEKLISDLSLRECSFGASGKAASSLVTSATSDVISDEEKEILESIVPSLNRNRQLQKAPVIDLDDDDDDCDIKVLGTGFSPKSMPARKRQSMACRQSRQTVIDRVRSCLLMPNKGSHNSSASKTSVHPSFNDRHVINKPKSSAVNPVSSRRVSSSAIQAPNAEHFNKKLSLPTSSASRRDVSNDSRSLPNSVSGNVGSTTTFVNAVSKLMETNSIVLDSVEEVLEIDGETVLIVHDEDDDNDDDSGN